MLPRLSRSWNCMGIHDGEGSGAGVGAPRAGRPWGGWLSSDAAGGQRDNRIPRRLHVRTVQDTACSVHTLPLWPAAPGGSGCPASSPPSMLPLERPRPATAGRFRCASLRRRTVGALHFGRLHGTDASQGWGEVAVFRESTLTAPCAARGGPTGRSDCGSGPPAAAARVTAPTVGRSRYSPASSLGGVALHGPPVAVVAAAHGRCGCGPLCHCRRFVGGRGGRRLCRGGEHDQFLPPELPAGGTLAALPARHPLPACHVD